tara:strand:+ start:948 stop:1127 length:180 start_codon:yes stop_codon:yes gene_type:complete
MINDVDRLLVLLDEVSVIKSRIQPQATGHLHTAVNVLNERIEEITKKLKKNENNGVHSQ